MAQTWTMSQDRVADLAVEAEVEPGAARVAAPLVGGRCRGGRRRRRERDSRRPPRRAPAPRRSIAPFAAYCGRDERLLDRLRRSPEPADQNGPGFSASWPSPRRGEPRRAAEASPCRSRRTARAAPCGRLRARPRGASCGRLAGRQVSASRSRSSQRRGFRRELERALSHAIAFRRAGVDLVRRLGDVAGASPRSRSSGSDGGPARAAGVRRSRRRGTQRTRACPARRVRKARMAARVGGRRKSSPKMSVMKPGVRRSAPPRMIIAPSKTSLPGTRPSASARLKRSQAARLWERASAAPTRLSTMRSASVGRTPIAPPISMISQSSAIGMQDEEDEKERQHAAPKPTRGRPSLRWASRRLLARVDVRDVAALDQDLLGRLDRAALLLAADERPLLEAQLDLGPSASC